MNIENIKYLLNDKKEFKNWKELCEYLGKKYNGQTNSRKALEKKFKQFFEFEKVEGSNKIRITKIFDKMKPNFKSKGSQLPEYLDPAILINLKSGEYVTKSEIARRIKIASDDLINFYGNGDSWKHVVKWLNNYDKDFCENDKNLWSQRNTKGFKLISFYINKVQSSYKKSFDSSMNRLQDKGLIIYKETRMISIPNDYTRYIKITMKNNGIEALKEMVFPWIYEDIVNGFKECEYIDTETVLEQVLSYYDMTDGITRKASDKEEKFLNDIENKLTREKGYERFKELMAASCWDMSIRTDYFNKFNQELAKYNLKTFKGYHIENVNNVEVDMNAVSKLNEVFYELRLKSEKKSLEEEFEKEWNKTHFLKNERRIGRKYDQYNKSFEEFAEKFIKL